jgi:hypothetical protein
LADRAIFVGVGRVDEVAAVAEGAEALLNESSAVFGFVFAVLVVVHLELGEAMCKFAFILIGTGPMLNEALTEL